LSEILVALPFGVLIGLAVGTLGGGGSVLAVPVLVYVLDTPVSEATTASLAVVVAGALSGGAAHARKQRVCWPHAASFTLAALPGLVAGTVAADVVGDKAVLAAFALVMLAAASAIWRKGDERESDDTWEGRRTCPPLRLPRDALAGAGVGFLTGLFGVGGGFLIVPTLAVGLAFTMRTAVGTSLVIIASTSAVGLVAHLLLGRTIPLDLTAALALPCVAGALVGYRISGRVPQPALARAFAVLVTAVAAYVLGSVAFLGAPPR
jgi:uncharacterized membrane protein YfcA